MGSTFFYDFGQNSKKHSLSEKDFMRVLAVFYKKHTLEIQKSEQKYSLTGSKNISDRNWSKHGRHEDFSEFFAFRSLEKQFGQQQSQKNKHARNHSIVFAKTFLA